MRHTLHIRWGRKALGAYVLAVAALGACDDAFKASPDKEFNLPPETFLFAQADSLAAQFYKVPVSWLGTDADGRVTHYRARWTCPPGTSACLVDSAWSTYTSVAEIFTLPVPERNARYTFEVAAVDDDGVADPTPARQSFQVFNNAPSAAFAPGTLPESSLPAVTFFFTSTDPDTTEAPDDGDAAVHLAEYRVWLDGSNLVTSVPVQDGLLTFRIEDFDGRFGARTVYLQVLDDGAALSDTVSHTWQVDSAPENGILLVDDCRQGGFLEIRSDQSYRDVLAEVAPDRTRILDIETIPSLLQSDLAANLRLFDSIIWYTDSDTRSSDALGLAREALLEHHDRGGRLLLVSGGAFGTDGAFGDLEPQFMDVFGIAEIFPGTDGGTNFRYSTTDTIQAAVHPGLTSFRMLSLGIGAIMELFAPQNDAMTRSLYFYPAGALVRGGFVNPEQYDSGVFHESSTGARSIYVSIPLGLPINTNMGENLTEIRELLGLAGMTEPASRAR